MPTKGRRPDDQTLVRGSRNEYVPPGRAMIPTPEEEALDAHRSEASKFGNRTLLFLVLFAGTALFRDEIVEFIKRIFP